VPLLLGYSKLDWIIFDAGKIFPSQGDLHIAPFTDDSLYMEQYSKAHFWLVFLVASSDRMH
jgi:hypothetical protein